MLEASAMLPLPERNRMDPEPSSRRMSLREIGVQLGLSHVTVSLALKENKLVSAKTRERVRRYVESIGYRPDPMLGALAHYRQSKAKRAMKAGVAWINAWPDHDRLRSYREFDGYWEGAKAEAEKSGYWLEEFRVGPECSPERLHRILDTRGVRGILLPPHAVQPDWGTFPWEDYSVVRLGRSLQSPRTHLVASNQMGNAMLAHASMRDRGYRRIGFVTGRLELVPNGHLFGVGWMAAQKMAPDEEPVPALTVMSYPVERRAEHFRRWLDHHLVDAILSDLPEICLLYTSPSPRDS